MNSERKKENFWGQLPQRLPRLTGRELFLAALCALTAFFLGICPLPFSTYPLGISFFCAASDYAVFAAAGALVASPITPLPAVGYALSVLIAAALRILMGLFVDTPSAKDGGEKKLFCEAVALRSVSAAVSTFTLSLFTIIRGGFRYYDLFGAIFSVICSALSTAVFCGAFTAQSTESKRLAELKKRAAHLAVAAALCLSLNTLPIKGISAGLATAFIFTNHFCQKYGLLTACISSLMCGAVCGVENIPVLIIASFTAYCVLDASPTLAAAVSCIAGSVCGVMISGSGYMADPFMSLLLGCAVYSTAKKLISQKDEAGDRSHSNSDAALQLRLSHLEDRLKNAEGLLCESTLNINSPRFCAELIRSVCSETDTCTRENKPLSRAVSRRLYELGFGRVEARALGKRELRILLFGERIVGNSERIGFIRRRLMEETAVRLAPPKTFEYRGKSALLFSREPLISCRHALATSPREQVCGDSAAVFFDEARNYLYALICDGMGSGEDANAVSTAASEALKLLLLCGFSPENALALLAKELAEGYEGKELTVTADLLAIDLYDGEAALFKSGAAPSYLVRGGEVTTLSARTVPMGIMSKSDLRRIDLNLRDGDLLIMVSDGVSECENDSLPLLDYISAHSKNQPDEIVGDVIELSRKNRREDDLSAIAVKIFSQNY